MSKEAESNLEATDMFRQRGIENRPLTRSAKAMTDGRRESGKGNVGQMYYQFGRGIREGEGCQPHFDEAVRLNRFIDSIQEASDQSHEVAVR